MRVVEVAIGPSRMLVLLLQRRRRSRSVMNILKARSGSVSDVPVVVADVPVVADRFSSGRVAVLAAGRRNVLAFENHVAAVLISGWK